VEKTSVVGKNLTGIDTSPALTEEMVEGSRQSIPPEGGIERQVQLRQQYNAEADRIGSVPPPATFKGMANTFKDKLMGRSPEVLMDKLGERIAFERSGTRLYDLMITKCKAGRDGLIPLEQLRHFREEEARHFKLAADALESMGGDSTAETPSADVFGVASRGIVAVLSDPRTTVAQCLGALLTAEMTDNAGWELLIVLAEGMGLHDTAQQFMAALAEEQEHLAQVRRWYEQAVLSESGTT
jgi:ferritin-like protein